MTWKVRVKRTNLSERQTEPAFQHRVDCGQERLHHVVQQMAERDRAQNCECGSAGLRPGNDGLAQLKNPSRPFAGRLPGRVALPFKNSRYDEG